VSRRCETKLLAFDGPSDVAEYPSFILQDELKLLQAGNEQDRMSWKQLKTSIENLKASEKKKTEASHNQDPSAATATATAASKRLFSRIGSIGGMLVPGRPDSSLMPSTQSGGGGSAKYAAGMAVAAPSSSPDVEKRPDGHASSSGDDNHHPHEDHPQRRVLDTSSLSSPAAASARRKAAVLRISADKRAKLIRSASLKMHLMDVGLLSSIFPFASSDLYFFARDFR
jgi:hypothetical protein